MKKYYKSELDIPLNEFLSKPYSTITIQVNCEGEKSKNININLDSIPAIRELLNAVEQKIVGDMQ